LPVHGASQGPLQRLGKCLELLTAAGIAAQGECPFLGTTLRIAMGSTIREGPET
jgi:hypothetical protein